MLMKSAFDITNYFQDFTIILFFFFLGFNVQTKRK